MAGVIGDPISHSLSPIIHNYLIHKYDINGSYLPFKVSESELNSKVQEFVNDKMQGFNVTLPHKENIFKICDHLSKTALRVKAVNTIIVTKDGKIFGHNSDGEGFINNIKQNAPNFSFKDKNIVILGAGGATRAVYYALLRQGIKKIIICNRNEIKAQSLINDFKDEFKNCNLILGSWDKKENSLKDCDLLINCTSLGMLGKDDLSVKLDNLNKEAIVTDIVYNPLMTNLLKDAKNKGHKTVTGIGMLINQALVGFEAWYGVKPEIDEGLIKLLESSFNT
jgi:shikimate dehydrogenase